MIVQGNVVLNRTVVDSDCSPGRSCSTYTYEIVTPGFKAFTRNIILFSKVQLL